MAITFDAANKIIQLDSLATSAGIIWSRWVDWISTHQQYFHAMSQLGKVAPVAEYIYLENGWRVRPVESDGITTITGNLIVRGGGSPVVATEGNWNNLVNMETPVLAQAIEINTGSGMSIEEHNKLMSGLDESIPENTMRYTR